MQLSIYPRCILLVVMAFQSGCSGAQESASVPGAGRNGGVNLIGQVTSPVGKPIAGARVAVYPPGAFRARHLAVTRPDGRFAVAVDEGTYALTATATGHSAAHLGEHKVRGISTPVTLRLGEPARVFHGVVRDEDGRAIRGALVRATQGFPETRLFYAVTGPTGRYELGLPDDDYILTVEPGDRVSPNREYYRGGDVELNFVAYPWKRVNRPAPDAVVDWIRSHAIPLDTVVAGHGFEDLRRLKPIIGDARIVSLGEATHGTREFFQAKHRLVEYLVTELGFSIFAIEASLPDAMAVNAYVLHGQGNAARALAGMKFWTWDTEEVLQMIEWMRRYNADPSHGRKVRFYGFDMQYTDTAVVSIVNYIAQSAPEHVEKVKTDLKTFSPENWQLGFADLPTEVRLAARRGAEDVAALLDKYRDDTEAWVRARRYVTVIVQAAEMFAPTTQPRGDIRDKAMADNVGWIARSHPEARIVLWAHNVHISKLDSDGFRAMGGHLAATFGDRYFSLALSFGEGAFQARERLLGRKAAPLVARTVSLPSDHYVEVALARVGTPLFVIDLRNRPRTGPVASWFDTPHPMRTTGGNHKPPDYPWGLTLLDREFDAVLYVHRTTRARPTPTGRRDQ